MVTTMSHQQILAVSKLSHVSILRGFFLSCVICAEVESQKSLDKNNSADAGMHADAFTSLQRLAATAHTPSSSPRPDPGDWLYLCSFSTLMSFCRDKQCRRTAICATINYLVNSLTLRCFTPPAGHVCPQLCLHC